MIIRSNNKLFNKIRRRILDNKYLCKGSMRNQFLQKPQKSASLQCPFNEMMYFCRFEKGRQDTLSFILVFGSTKKLTALFEWSAVIVIQYILYYDSKDFLNPPLFSLDNTLKFHGGGTLVFWALVKQIRDQHVYESDNSAIMDCWKLLESKN